MPILIRISFLVSLTMSYLIYFISFKRSKCVLSLGLKQLLLKLILLFTVIKRPFVVLGAVMIRRIFNGHLRDFESDFLSLTFRVNSPVWILSSIASSCSSSRINFEFVAVIWSRVVLRSFVKRELKASVFVDIKSFVSSNFLILSKIWVSKAIELWSTCSFRFY